MDPAINHYRMDQRERHDSDPGGRRSMSENGILSRLLTIGSLSVILLGAVPTVSAHGGAYAPNIPHGYGLVILGGGLAVLGGSVVGKRTDHLRPTTALHGVFVGLVLIAIGAIGFNSLAPETTYTAQSMPFPRAWYQPIALFVGGIIMIGSVIGGRLRWPTRPRYTLLGLELGLWVAYPALLSGSGAATHPLGYALVGSVPLTVGYILWTDCRTTIRTCLQDHTARRFGAGIAVVVAFFFMFAAGFMSFISEEGVGVVGVPDTATITVMPTSFPLVTWPTLEWWFPTIPFVGMLSIGVIIVVGMIGGLVGLNAAIAARLWTAGETMDTNQGAAGTAAFVGTSACSCCGPIVAQFIILALGPSAAAPLYWLFVDTASPAGALLLVTSIALLTASLLHAVNVMGETPACTREESPSAAGVQADQL